MRKPLIVLAVVAPMCLVLVAPAQAASPIVTLDSPANNSATSDTTPTISGTTDTPVPDVTVKIYPGTAASGTPVQTLSATPVAGAWAVDATPALAAGVYTAQAEQSNGVDPVGTSNASTFRVGSPAVTLDAPAALSNNRTPTFTGTAGTATGDSPVTVTINSGGSPVQTLTAPVAGGGNWSVAASSPLADGTYTVQAQQMDSAGNPPGTSAVHTFTIDATSPVVALLSPSNGSQTNNTTPPFHGSAGTAPGDSSVVSVEIYAGTAIAGSPQVLSAAVSGGGWVTTTWLAQGTYTARARQSDSAGNTGFSAPRTFTIDTTPPGVTIISRTIAATTATFSFVTTEPANLECRLDGVAFLPCGSTITYSNLAEGLHTFEVRATDLAGNTNPNSTIASWRVDTSTALAPIRPFPIVRIAGRLTRTGVSLTTLEVTAVPGVRIRLTCRGRSCPVRDQSRTTSARSAAPKARAANTVRFTRFRRLSAGVVIEIRITKPGAIGKYTRFVIRKRKLPARSDACLIPGQSKPVRCPS